MITTMRKHRIIRNSIWLCIMVIALGTVACVLYNYSSLSLKEINVPDYILISSLNDGTYQFSLDKDRIRHDFFFPDDASLPENSSLDSLTLIVRRAGDSVYFEVGSTEDNAGTMLRNGGYILSNTVWAWTAADVTAKYTESLSVPKFIPLKKYVHFRSDGNYNWTPYIDFDGLASSIGDRLKYDSSLNTVVMSLSVSPTSFPDGSIRIDTWSSYKSAGSTVESILRSCDVTVTDTVFTTNADVIAQNEARVLSLKNYVVFDYSGSDVVAHIDNAAIKADFNFREGSAAALVIDALSLLVEKQGDSYSVSAYSSVNDLDVTGILYQNGVTMTDTSFHVSGLF